MKTFILFLIMTTSAFAADDFFKRNLDHLGTVRIDNIESRSVKRDVHYPGLGGRQYDMPDCLVLIPNSKFRTNAEELKQLAEQIEVHDGAGILFGDDDDRAKNKLEAEVVLSGMNPYLKFHLKDLGKYVTGVRVQAASPSLSLSQVVESIFERSNGPIQLLYLRGCAL